MLSKSTKTPRGLIKKFMQAPVSKRSVYILIFVSALHIFLLASVGTNIKGDSSLTKTPERIIKLADIQEQPEAEPPPPDNVQVQQNTVDPLAETLIETDQPIEEVAMAAAAPVSQGQNADNDYLPQFKVSQTPVFDQRSILPVFPPIALRSGIEGLVFLELFIDKQGYVRKVVVLKETPEGRGFGEAAAAAFEGKKCKPAEANGEPVAVRYRYPVRFTITAGF